MSATAENEPAKNLQKIAKFCQFCQLNFVISGRLAEDGGDQPEARAVQGPLRQLLEFHQRRGAGPPRDSRRMPGPDALPTRGLGLGGQG